MPTGTFLPPGITTSNVKISTGGTNNYVLTAVDSETIQGEANLTFDSSTLTVTGAVVVGSDGSGHNVTFYSDTGGDHFVWSSSAEKLTITGTNAATALDVADGNVSITDDLDVGGTTNLDVVDIDDAVNIDGDLTFNGPQEITTSSGALSINPTTNTIVKNLAVVHDPDAGITDAWVHVTMDIVNYTSAATALTITPSTSSGTYTMGLVEVWTMGHNSGHDEGYTLNRWKFEISGGNPVVAQIGSDETGGNSPPVLDVDSSTNDIIVTIAKNASGTRFDGTLYARLFLPNGAGSAVTYTITKT